MKKKTANLLLLFVAVVMLQFAAAEAAAFTFSPMSTTIAPSGAQSVMTYKVTNDSQQQIAVAIKVMTRDINQLGVEINEPSDSTFLIFPSRIVLAPGSTQNVKIQYRGQVNLQAEAAYRVIAEQLPIDFSKATSSGVNIMLKYIAALYVTPAKVTPDIKIFSIIGIKKNDVVGLEITLKNDGTRHSLLSHSLIRITQSSGFIPVEFSGDALASIDGQNILARSTRIFFVPWSSAEMGATYEGAFSAEYE